MTYSQQTGLPEFALKIKGRLDKSRKVLIRTHEGPHADEATAIVFAKEYVDDDFFRDYATPIFLTNADFQDLFPGEKKEPVHLIVIGVESGDLDEHPGVNKVIKDPKKCCAELTAEALKINHLPEVVNLLSYIAPHDKDNYQQNGKRDIGSVMRILNKAYPDVDSQVDNLVWAISGLEIKLFFDKENNDCSIDRIAEVAKRFSKDIDLNMVEWLDFVECGLAKGRKNLDATFDSFEKMKEGKDFFSYIIPVYNYKTKKIIDRKIIAIKSDDSNIGVSAMAKDSGKASVVIIQNSRGQYAILTQKWHFVSSGEITTVLNLKEQAVNGKIVETDWHKLKSEGSVAGSEVWFHQLRARRVLNGSLSHPETPPSKLSFEEIVKGVLLALDSNKYKYEDCVRGFCRLKKCPSYWYGLNRCFDIRERMFERRNRKKSA